MVGLAGLEPARPYGQQILSLQRLPIPPRGQRVHNKNVQMVVGLDFNDSSQHLQEASLGDANKKGILVVLNDVARNKHNFCINIVS